MILLYELDYSKSTDNDIEVAKKFIDQALSIYNLSNDTVIKEVSQESDLDNICNDHEVVILLGINLARRYLNQDLTHLKSVRSRVLYKEDKKVFVSYSPMYLVHNSEYVESFTKDFELVSKYLQGELVSISDKNLKSVHSYFELKNILISPEYLDSDLISYDIETNAVDPRLVDFRIVGFSIASSNAKDGVYVAKEYLEGAMDDEEWDKIVEFMKYYLTLKSEIVVHNCMYEIPATMQSWRYDLSSQIVDTLAKAKLLRGGNSSSASLKELCQTLLGYPDWDTDLGLYRDGFMLLISNLRGSSGRYSEYKDLGLLGYYESLHSSEDNLNKTMTKLYNSLGPMIQVIKDYYDGSEFYDIIKVLDNKIRTLVEDEYWNNTFSYGYLPLKVISKYGAMDSVATIDLNNYFDSEIEKESKMLNIDLDKGYQYTVRQFLVGSALEINGLYWNDEVAQVESEWCSSSMISSLKNMLHSGFLDEHIFNNTKHKFIDEFKEKYLEELPELLPKGSSNLRVMKSCIKYTNDINGEVEKITWKNLIPTLNELNGIDIYENHKDEIMEKAFNFIDSTEDISELKSIFNPASTVPYIKDLLSNIFITEDVRIAHLLNKINVEISSDEFDIRSIRASDRPIYQVLIDCRDENNKLNKYRELEDRLEDRQLNEELQEEFEDLSVETKALVYNTSEDTMSRFIEALKVTNISDRNLISSVTESLSYRLDSIAEIYIVELAKYYQILGVDVDDFDTWTDRYKFLVDFRMYKKCAKMKSTYIDGNKVGRGRVYTVDAEELSKGTNGTIVPRLRNYVPNKSDSESYLMQASYNVCGASTLRWKAGMHTIPSDSTIKNIYTSRFKGGCIIAPDFSQLELRCVAGLSNCTPMIDAFKSGADIHMNNAVQIFGRPADEITPAERRYAKMSSFSILYGADANGFGDNFLNGDRELAHQIYNKFYTAFPQVGTWIDAKHEEMKSTGKVTTIMGTYIKISPEDFGGGPGAESKALRAAQNYPFS